MCDIQLSHTLEASDSCSISRYTVQKVENCPESKEKWKEAAARKKCEDYAIFCDEPKRLKYHCVISSFINETLEVCAYTQNIVLGHCTDYSISGNLIKQNRRTNCKAFESKPCPLFYFSTEAYKYPGCYELTKRSKKQTPIHLTVLSSIYEPTHTTTNSSGLLLAGKKDNILGASPGLEDIGNGRGHAMIRSMLMTVSGETLRKILELFREQQKFKDRVKLVMEAYELFWSS